MDGHPAIVVLAGANGAGKTTAARTILVDLLRLFTFVNADEIARGLSPFAPETVAFEAGRIMLNRLNQLAKARESFAFETTLAGKAYRRWLAERKDEGYEVHLLYFWAGQVEMNVQRVAQRVADGGHNIPDATIRQRYQRSIRNFLKEYRSLASTWCVYDNAGEFADYNWIAAGRGNEQLAIRDEAQWKAFVSEASR